MRRAALLLVLAGCAGPDGPVAETGTGVAIVLAGPRAGVDCIAFTLADEDGTVTTRAFALAGRSAIHLSDVAAGAYDLTAAAYPSGRTPPITDAECLPPPARPPWTTEAPVVVIVQRGQTSAVTVTLVTAGTAGSILVLDDAITVSTDPTVIDYPDDYLNAPAGSVAVLDPYCTVKRDSVTYPRSYLGAFPLPAIDGAPLPAAIPRGVHLKDFWRYGLHDPATNPGCTGSLHDAYRETLRRAKLLGADHVAFYQDATPIDATAAHPVFDVNISENQPDEIAFIVSEAKAQGLAVYEFMQINAGDPQGSSLPMTTPSADVAAALLDGYSDFLVGQAAYAQELGIDAFQLDWGAYFFEWAPLRDVLNQKMTVLAQRVRAVYSGKIMYGALEPSVQDDPVVFANVDWLLVDLYGISFSAADNDAISVPLMRGKYLDVIRDSHDRYGGFGKPAVFRLFVQSHRNYFRDGWVEDGFCVPTPSDCSQQRLTVDFSVQAIGTEAMLEAMTTQTDYAIAAVGSTAWFYTDVLLGDSAWPSTSQSPRDKPAEAITYRWFQR